MSLRLQGVSKVVDGEVHIHPTDLDLEKGSMNVLLGPTLAGKTSLMRLMAGLDKPDTGRIFWDGQDVTGRRVQDRDIAMVYQQFVNYPSMTVYENIASPLRLQKRPEAEIDARVREMVDLLKLTDQIDHRPDQISGGQQQRCAIARALAKDVGLVLMDEPLANLDYKLREELRLEIPRLFAAKGSIFVYATTEPEEALLLGGNTAAMWEGRVTQFGPATQVYREPEDDVTARVYSDPQINLVPVRKEGAKVHFPSGQVTQADRDFSSDTDGEYLAGFRAHHLEVGEQPGERLVFEVAVSATDITGSESFLHLEVEGADWVALVPGVRNYEAGSRITVSLDPRDVLYFNADGKRVGAEREGAG